MIKTKYQEKINELRVCFTDTEKRIKNIELETSGHRGQVMLML